MTQQEILLALPDVLVPWYQNNARPMPWRQDKEPYHVWLSEIMLQQTRIEAAKEYYLRFIRELPDVQSLALAEPDRLNKLWEGLGYYSRVRNLQAAAKQLMWEYGGEFPKTKKELLKLKGIGEYTAGAIASICFEQPESAVDGNVLRVISRLTLDSRSVLEPTVRQDIGQKLKAIYPEGACGAFTQALMELGETVCLPNAEPLCDACPARELCRARPLQAWRELPVRPAKKPRRQEEMTVFIFLCDGFTAVRKREETGLLAGLWEFPNLPGRLSSLQALTQAISWGTAPVKVSECSRKTHIFTHVQWDMFGYYIHCHAKPEGFAWVSKDEMNKIIALPTAFKKFWAERK